MIFLIRIFQRYPSWWGTRCPSWDQPTNLYANINNKMLSTCLDVLSTSAFVGGHSNKHYLKKSQSLNINTFSFTDTVAMLRLLYFDWTILHVLRASLCQSYLFSSPWLNSSLVMKCTSPFSKSALKQIRLSAQTGLWPTKTTKIKLKTNSESLKPQRPFSEKTSQLWQWLLTNAPFSDSSGAQ